MHTLPQALAPKSPWQTYSHICGCRYSCTYATPHMRISANARTYVRTHMHMHTLTVSMITNSYYLLTRLLRYTDTTENLYDFYSGIVGGAAGVVVGQPLDVVRVRAVLQYGEVSVVGGMNGG